MSHLIALPILLLAVSLAVCTPSDEAEPAADATLTDGLRRDLLEAPDHGETSVRADLDLSLGSVTVGEAKPGTLFQAEVVLPTKGLQTTFETTTVSTESGPRARVRLGLGGEVRPASSTGHAVSSGGCSSPTRRRSTLP